MQKRPACERCFQKRKKCVWSSGARECERCERNSVDCVARVRRKPGRVPGATAAGKAVNNKKRKTKVAAASNTRDAHSFWSAMADGWILPSLVRLGPNHWGLQNMLYALTARAYAQGSAALLSRAYALVNTLGVGLRDVTGPLVNGIRHTLHTTFESFSDVPMRHHDRALGLAPQPWTPGSLGERIVVIATGVNAGAGHVGMSPAFRTIIGEEVWLELATNSTPCLFIGGNLLQDQDRGVQAAMYLVEHYTSKEVGPLSAKIPGVSSKSGLQYDLYTTIWSEELGHFYNIFELVPVTRASAAAASSGGISSAAAASSGGISAVSIDEVPDEDLTAARSLTNLMR